MVQETNTEGAQAAAEGTSTDTGTEAETQTDASKAADQTEKTFDAEYVGRLRKEAAENRTKAKAFEAERDALKAKVQASEDAELTEKQRVEKERDKFADEAKKLLEVSNNRALDYEAVVLANKLNIVDPDAAVRLLDRSDIEWSDAGRPTNLQTLMEALLVAKPYLKGATKPVVPDLGATNSASTSGRTDSKGSALTLEEIKKMTPQEQSKRQEEVFAFLKNHRGTKKN